MKLSRIKKKTCLPSFTAFANEVKGLETNAL